MAQLVACVHPSTVVLYDLILYSNYLLQVTSDLQSGYHGLLAALAPLGAAGRKLLEDTRAVVEANQARC